MRVSIALWVAAFPAWLFADWLWYGDPLMAIPGELVVIPDPTVGMVVGWVLCVPLALRIMAAPPVGGPAV